MWCDNPRRFFGQVLAGKDHITWWMLPADGRAMRFENRDVLETHDHKDYCGSVLDQCYGTDAEPFQESGPADWIRHPTLRGREHSYHATRWAVFTFWRQFRQPHPPIFAKNMPRKYSMQRGVVWRYRHVQTFWKWIDSFKNVHWAYGLQTPKYGIQAPTFMP